jgi:hypothetical protein
MIRASYRGTNRAPALQTNAGPRLVRVARRSDFYGQSSSGQMEPVGWPSRNQRRKPARTSNLGEGRSQPGTVALNNRRVANREKKWFPREPHEQAKSALFSDRFGRLVVDFAPVTARFRVLRCDFGDKMRLASVLLPQPGGFEGVPRIFVASIHTKREFLTTNTVPRACPPRLRWLYRCPANVRAPLRGHRLCGSPRFRREAPPTPRRAARNIVASLPDPTAPPARPSPKAW